MRSAFDDIKVRQAFAKAIDRDTIIEKVVGKQGVPAYSFLMPGFPDASQEVLKELDVNQYDVAAAQQLMVDAGYPGGEGFPKHGAVAAPGGSAERSRSQARWPPC